MRVARVLGGARLHLQVAAHDDRALRRQVEHAGAVGGVAGEPEEQGTPPPRQGGDVSTSEPQRRKEVEGAIGLQVHGLRVVATRAVEGTRYVLAVVEPNVVT